MTNRTPTATRPLTSGVKTAMGIPDGDGDEGRERGHLERADDRVANATADLTQIARRVQTKNSSEGPDTLAEDERQTATRGTSATTRADNVRTSSPEPWPGARPGPH